MGDLARFLSGRFYAKRTQSGLADTFLKEKFTFRKVGTVLTPNRRTLIGFFFRPYVIDIHWGFAVFSVFL